MSGKILDPLPVTSAVDLMSHQSYSLWMRFLVWLKVLPWERFNFTSYLYPKWDDILQCLTLNSHPAGKLQRSPTPFTHLIRKLVLMLLVCRHAGGKRHLRSLVSACRSLRLLGRRSWASRIAFLILHWLQKKLEVLPLQQDFSFWTGSDVLSEALRDWFFRFGVPQLAN